MYMQPRRKSRLFKLPPYVRDLDLEKEIIILSNPESQPVDLTGYWLADRVSLFLPIPHPLPALCTFFLKSTTIEV